MKTCWKDKYGLVLSKTKEKKMEELYNQYLKNGDKSLDTNAEQQGFIYILGINEKGKKTITSEIKIGCSTNPIFRLADHFFKGFKDKSIFIDKVYYCFDYLKCEAEIKKLTRGKEVFEFEEELLFKIYFTVEKYGGDELDKKTVETLVKSPNMFNFFNKKQNART